VVTEQWSIFLREDPMGLTPLLRRAARFAFERAELVLPTSEALRHGIEREGIRGRFRVVPNTVDTELFRPNGGHAESPRLVALVLTSRYDNNPCAVIEGLASGLPVVATAVGGVPELVDDGNGLLARPEDPESISGRITELLDGLDRYDSAAISEAARERFGHERVGDQLAHAYGEALELRHRR